jgi:hypothetical protein
MTFRLFRRVRTESTSASRCVRCGASEKASLSAIAHLPAAMIVSRRRQAHLFDQLRAVLDAAPSRALYCYPTANYTHLLVDAENPTRFAYAYPGSPLTSAEQMEEIVQALAATRPPYIVTGGQITRAEDRIARYVREHYEKAPAPRPLASVLWRRKSETAPDDDGGS